MNKPEEESWPILRLLEWTAGYLKEKGAESPRLDAEVLLASVRKCLRIDLYTAFDEIADAATRTEYKTLVKRRATGEPVAYLVGHKEFYSRDYEVTAAVLIPRPETEFVVIAALDLASENSLPDSLRVADIGTGSGNLAITLAKEKPDWKLVATDIQADAIDVARRNAVHHAVDQQIEFRCGPFFCADTEPEPFDIVVSNPPYVSDAEYVELSATVHDYEPKVALVAGERGTEIIKQLLEESGSRVRLGGVLIVEMSPMIEADVRAFIDQHAAWKFDRIYKDHAGHSRVVVAIRV